MFNKLSSLTSVLASPPVRSRHRFNLRLCSCLSVPSLQAQVSLDHDYCSSGNKGSKRHRWTNPAATANQQLLQLQRPRWTTMSNAPSSATTLETSAKNVSSSASLLSVNKVSPSPIVIATSATSSPRCRRYKTFGLRH